MSLKIEFRYAVLNSMLMLLWLALEYVIGLHDKYIYLHPAVTLFALVIPIYCYRMALKDKKAQSEENFSFKQGFRTGLIMTIFFCTLLAVPVQYVFHRYINPGFFEDMIQFSVKHGKSTYEQAAQYFNFRSYMIQSVVSTFVIGILLSLIAAWIVRTKQ